MRTQAFIFAISICAFSASVVAAGPSASASRTSQSLSLASSSAKFGAVFASPMASSKDEPGAREAWLDSAVAKLKAFAPSTSAKAAKRRVHLRSGRVRYVVEDEGVFRLKDGQWLYVLAHSEHHGDGVGNAILAVDHDGSMYVNDAHVCHSVEVRPVEGSDFSTVHEVLESRVDGAAWRRLEPR